MKDNRLLYIIFLILSITLLMIYQVSKSSLVGIFSIEDLFVRIKNPMVQTKEFLSVYLKDKRELHKRLLSMEEKLTSLRVRIEETESLRKENQRLKRLLGLTEASDRRYVTAKIIVRVGGRFNRHLVINKGFKEGLKKDMPVRSVDGLVGKLYRVGPDYSVVLPVTDINFSVAVQTERTGASGILSGGGFGPCRLKYVSKEEDIKRGDKIITSGLDGIFPEGIPVGVITKVTPGEGLFYEIEVKPFSPPEKTKEVVVIVR